MKHIRIYTDGSTWPKNPGNGGWGAVLLFGEVEKRVSGPLPDPTTNNQAETAAVAGALDHLKEPCKVTIYTDSQYVSLGLDKVLHKGWLPKTNRDQWRDVAFVVRSHDIKVVHVRGHTGVNYNEVAHKLAYNAAKHGEEVEEIIEPKAKTS